MERILDWLAVFAVASAFYILGVSTCEADTHIGTINFSYHFDRSEDLCETHNGLYVVHETWLLGGYQNSHCRDSVVLGRSWPLSERFSATVAVASNYDTKSFDGWLPVVWATYRVGFVTFSGTKGVVFLGTAWDLD